MDINNFDDVTCVYKPMRPFEKSKLVKLIEDKHQVQFGSYWDLHKWSVENYSSFWAEVWDFSKVKCSKTYDEIIEDVPLCDVPKWFIGAKLNLAENFLVHNDDHVAMIAIGEDRDKKVITYADVYYEVKRYAAAFRKHGLKKGDKVVCYMSNREEAVFAMFAVNSIGAIWIGILPLLGAQAVLDRLEQIKPNIILTVDRLCYNKEEINMLPKLKEISSGLPSLEKVIIVRTKLDYTEKDVCEIPKSCFLEEFLKLGQNKDGSVPDIIFEQVSLSDPVFIYYTSGTTGKPKALIHGAGCMLGYMRDQYIHGNFSRQIVSLAVTPAGWASWTFVPFSFRRGSTSVLFDGFPYLLSPTYFWDLVEEFKVSFIFMTPGNLDDMEKRGIVPTEKHKLSHLTMIFSAASVAKSNNYDFVYQKIKPSILYSSAYGSTEAMVGVIGFHLSLPVYKGEIPCPSLGIDIQIISEKGTPVIGEVGDLVIGNPIPSLPLGLYGDMNGLKYKETYFSKYSDKFALGDLAAINPKTKGTIIYCRNDELLKPGGTRFGSTEIYNVVNHLPEVYDSLCVAQYSKDQTERAVLFLKIRKGYKLDASLVQKIQRKIEKELTKKHIPGLIMEVPDIPYNMNGKKMEALVKKIINKMPFTADVVKNKESLEFYFNVPLFEP